MKETFYFQHDYNPTSDPKITCLLGNYGGLGYGVFWRIIEMLHQEESHKLPHKKFIYEAIAKQMLANAEQIEAIINSCINDYELLQKDDLYFWSNRVNANISKREELSKIRQKAGRAGAIAKQSSAKPSKGKEIKGKEIKDNISIGIRDYWNSLQTLPESVTGIKNTDARERLLPECRKITADITDTFSKLVKKGYGEEDFKLGIKNYVGNIINRDPNNDFCNHRFSLYEFFTQKNGFIKFLN